MSTKIDIGEDKNVFIIDPSQVLKPRIQSSILMEDIAKSADDAMLEARVAYWNNWVGSDPLLVAHIDDSGKSHLFFTSESMENKVLLLHFWDFTLLPSVRSLEFTREWHKRYESAGLTVVGVHCPRFEFAKDKNTVHNGMRFLEVTYPVVLDNDLKIWRALENRFWPRWCLISHKHEFVADLIGEGRYEDFEIIIQKTLRQKEPGLPCPPAYRNKHGLDEKGTEFFLGSKNPKLFENLPENLVDGVDHMYPESSPSAASLEKIALSGSWVMEKESIHQTTTNRTASVSRLTFNTKGKSVYMVALVKSKALGEIPPLIKVPVTLNKRPLSEEFQGEDITISDSKGSQMQVLSPRLYHLAANLPENKVNEITITLDNNLNEYVEIFAFFCPAV